MRVIGVIPARMGSSRFPGKPLAPLRGRPMIEHVYRGTVACERLDRVVIATCDDEIARAGGGFGAMTVMTSATHERASDRVAEAVAKDPADIVVMVQGDEPMVHPAMIDSAIAPLAADSSIGCVTLVSPIRTVEEMRDPNTIKTVVGRSGRALYFSREPIPSAFARAFTPGGWFKQVCVISFRRETLLRFQSLPRGPLESAESIDMLRFLENDVPVHVVQTSFTTHAVDTPADLDRVASLMSGAFRSDEDS